MDTRDANIRMPIYFPRSYSTDTHLYTLMVVKNLLLARAANFMRTILGSALECLITRGEVSRWPKVTTSSSLRTARPPLPRWGDRRRISQHSTGTRRDVEFRGVPSTGRGPGNRAGSGDHPDRERPGGQRVDRLRLMGR